MAFLSKAGKIPWQTKRIIQQISASNPSIFQTFRCISSSKLFVGGLSYSTDDRSLLDAFSKYGQVAEARVIVDRTSGRSRGFGFVTFSSPEEASAALQALDGKDLQGRRIRVDHANDRTRGFGGGGYGGGSFGSGGYTNNSGYAGNLNNFGGNHDGGFGSETTYGRNFGGGAGGSNNYFSSVAEDAGTGTSVSEFDGGAESNFNEDKFRGDVSNKTESDHVDVDRLQR